MSATKQRHWILLKDVFVNFDISKNQKEQD